MTGNCVGGIPAAVICLKNATLLSPFNVLKMMSGLAEVGLEELMSTAELAKLLLRILEFIDASAQQAMELLFAICWYRREDKKQVHFLQKSEKC